MHFQFDCPPIVALPAPQGDVPPPAFETTDLLRQILDVQREQLAYLRASVAAHDMASRWRAFLDRWQRDFPELSGACQKAVPILERTYSKLIAELTDHLSEQGDDALDNDFTLQEFLDRFGLRLAQLGTVLNLVAPLAEVGAQDESR